ncbi:MAG: helix-turn-helix transcriptional regulator [Prochloraceae cyanobacterium]|nr:helix-turn-helix transcriptional regulator [Prochloraceae cyanobacterium]
MDSNERKKLFAVLVQEILAQCGNVKVKLAKQLGISGGSLTHWLQGKIDPGGLGIKTFAAIADVKGVSVDELADYLGFFEPKFDKSLEKFRQLLQELLENNSQDELAQKTGISQGSISKWLDPERQFDLENISAMRIAAIAKQKKWSIERLLNYLDLKQKKQFVPCDLKAEAADLSLSEQVELLAWLSGIIDRKIKESENISPLIKKQTTGDIKSERNICIVLEKDDIKIVSEYLSSLGHYTQLQLKNITIATPSSLPESLSFFDVLLFDLNNQQSPCIPLIESLQFDGDVVAIVDRSLPEDIQDRLKEKVTEVIVKPVPWSELKQKAYFM